MVRISHDTLCALTAVLLATVSTPVFAADTPVEKPQQNFPAIVVTQAQERKLIDRIIATGTIKAVDEVYVQPQLEGLSIKTLNADVGDSVTADSILAVLSDDSLLLEKSQAEANKAKANASLAQLQAQLLEAQANADDANRQRDRAVKLNKNGTVSTSQVEQLTSTATASQARAKSAEQSIVVAQAELKVVDAQIADIDLKLARTGVKTPVSGIVSARNARVGAIASGSGQPLFTVISDGALELVADISESDVLRIKPGQKATLTVAGSPVPLTGSVRLVSPTIDAVTRLGSIHIDLDDDSKARAGMYGTADIIIQETQGIALPLTAVTTGKGENSARKVENDVVKLVKVETGIQDGAFIQIVSGLKAGEEVVAKAGAYVRDGDHISPVRDPQAASN